MSKTTYGSRLRLTAVNNQDSNRAIAGQKHFETICQTLQNLVLGPGRVQWYQTPILKSAASTASPKDLEALIKSAARVDIPGLCRRAPCLPASACRTVIRALPCKSQAVGSACASNRLDHDFRTHQRPTKIGINCSVRIQVMHLAWQI